MLPQGQARWFSSVDAFRTVPKDLSEATATGAVMTLVTIVVCTALFVCEVSAFVYAPTVTRIVVDSNEDASLTINFDVTMIDLDCDHLTVGVWDAFGTDRVNVTKDISKQRVDHAGESKGAPYTEDELLDLEFSSESFTAEELAELDSDWASKSDSFQHDSFEAVVNAHEYIVVNFFADWCGHCRDFAPTWKEFEDGINSGAAGVLDADGSKVNIRALRLNCVDFEDDCEEQHIRGFPTIRLYKRSIDSRPAYIEYGGPRGPRAVRGLNDFVQSEIKNKHLHAAGSSYHAMFKEGCRVSGTLAVPRVPGTVHFQAGNSRDKTINPKFTNVSHSVNHFSFGDSPRRSISSLPAEYKRNVNPMDGKTFAVDKFHQAPIHFMKVVHTRFDWNGIRSYQQTHQASVRTLQRSAVPQAKFSYDLAPVEVLVTKGERRWYDLVTKIFAIIGGAFSVMTMTVGFAKLTADGVKGALGKKL